MFSILQKPQDNVNAEDLETLQNEIERYLVDIVIQKWNLERELIALNNTSPDLNNPSISAPNLPSGKLKNSHGLNQNDVPDSTKSSLFLLSNNDTTITGGTNSNEDSVSSEGSLVKFRSSLEESRPKQILKNEAPDKLWPFVEQFCATPTEEQITELEETIKAMDSNKDYFKIPALGKKDSAPAKSKSGKSKSKVGDDETAGLGALTQRLVSSFMEEVDDVGTDVYQAKGKMKTTKVKSSKIIDINNAKNLERRIRQELEECDILNCHDDIPYTSEDDEVLRELVASQHELLSIQRQNKDSMQRLLKRAKRHLELDNEREKLREANADVIAAYHRLIQAKQRKRKPSKKEKDAAWKALEVQGSIFKRCDELYRSSI